MNRCPPWVMALAALMLSGVAIAQTPNDALLCAEESPVLDRTRFLRALSFDLRGTMPTVGETLAIAERDPEEDVPGALIDDWLASEAFAAQVVRRHRSLLWNNISGQRLINDQQVLDRRSPAYASRRRARVYRERTEQGREVYCANRPAEWDDEGNLVLEERESDGILQEGWVDVEPFWAPGTTVRVCGFEAQDNEYSADGTLCHSAAGLNKKDCGCGPNLLWCAPNNGGEILASFAESIELLIAEMIEKDDPYTDLFETRRFYVNGPMAHFYRYLAQTASLRFNPLPFDVESLPDDIGWNDRDAWTVVELPTSSAGVLTHPIFMLRFQTNRARASRFYDAFLCQPFQPPAGGLPPADDEESLKPDLQERAGCKYCHSLLEPAAAHWGRWNEAGGGYLDPAQFPAVHPECVECAERGNCNGFCRAYYNTRALTEDEQPYLGMLPAMTFRRDEHQHVVDQGPKLLLREAVADNRFPRCTAQRAAEWLLGRDMNQKDQPWLDELSYAFVHSGFSYQALIKAVVTSDRYRRLQ